jgi:hypothetical protein
LSEQTTPDAQRLPLWKDLLDRMLQEGADYGSIYPVEYFEEALREKRDTPAFGFAMAAFMSSLRAHERPMILTQRGQQGAAYIILTAAGAIGWVEQSMRSVLRNTKEQLWIAANTPRHLLTEQESKRLDSLEAKAAARLSHIRSADRKLHRLRAPDNKISG